jgi:hypothetical protein
MLTLKAITSMALILLKIAAFMDDPPRLLQKSALDAR